MPPEEVRKTILSWAYHEAGHAVVGWLLNEPFDFLEVIEADKIQWGKTQQGGYVSFQHEHPLIEIPKLIATHPSVARTRVACHVTTLLAGPHAQHLFFALNDEHFDEDDGELIWLDVLYFSSGPDPSADSDLGQVQRIVNFLYPRRSRRWWRHLYMMATWTEELFRIPEVWKVTDALAKCLDRQKVMEGVEALELMNRMWPRRKLDRKWNRRFFGR